ncbi:MAG: hypothetical protein JEY99_11915 [Spirochaetales bacterium]|nr:hypothetical protein [Spirochaetales bacterium]
MDFNVPSELGGVEIQGYLPCFFGHGVVEGFTPIVVLVVEGGEDFGIAFIYSGGVALVVQNYCLYFVGVTEVYSEAGGYFLGVRLYWVVRPICTGCKP